MRSVQQSNKPKIRRFILGGEIYSNSSLAVKFKGYYPQFGFARSKHDGVYIIFEISSGYIIGEGKYFKRAERVALEFLKNTDGNFHLIVENLRLPKKITNNEFV